MATVYVSQAELDFHRVGLWQLLNVGTPDDIPADWMKIIGRKVTSRQAYEKLATYGGLGFMQPRTEGDDVTFDRSNKRYTKRITPIMRGLGVEYSKQSEHKDLYGFVKENAPALKKAAHATQNLSAFTVLCSGFSGATTPTTTPDTKALFASDHPREDGSTQSNVGASALSPSSFAEAIQTIMAHTGDRGIPWITAGKYKLVYGPTNWDAANQLLNSQGWLSGTADHGTNAHYRGVIAEEVMSKWVGMGLSGLTDAWFLLPTQNAPLIRMQFQELETDVDKDVKKGLIMYVVDEEYVDDAIDFRDCFGANP